MGHTSQHKLSRRDAIKVLAAAAGASALANLPSKWTKPELTTGVLPVHAQTSVSHTLAVGADQTDSYCFDTNLVSTVIISPAAAGILMKYTINPDATVTISSPALLTGTAPTDATGTASLTFTAADSSGTGSIRVTWEFVNPSNGIGSGTQQFHPLGC